MAEGMAYMARGQKGGIKCDRCNGIYWVIK